MSFNSTFCRTGNAAWLYALLLIPLLTALRLPHSPREIHSAVRTTWDSLVGKVKERDSFYQKEIRKLDDSLKTPWIEQIAKEGRSMQVINQQKLLKELEAGLKKVLNQLDQLENSRKVRYGVVLLTDTKQISETVYDTASRSIVFKVFDAGTFVHETTHGIQFENKGLAYDKHSGFGIGDDIHDEIEAYKMEYYYDPDAICRLDSTAKITSLNSISEKWLKNLKTPFGIRLYACSGWAYVAQISIDIHSSPRRLARAYKCYPPPKNWPPRQTIAEDTNFVSADNFRTLR